LGCDWIQRWLSQIRCSPDLESVLIGFAKSGVAAIVALTWRK
jgi:hypothetical protein